jgi:PAS domain S-box-containing protein
MFKPVSSPGLPPLFAALAQSPDPVFVTNRLNRVVFSNASAERLLGYTSEEIAGLSCAELFAGCDVHGNRYCSEVCPVNQIAVRHEPVRQFVLRLKAKDGRTVTAEVSILHLVAPPPDPFFLAHILRPEEISPSATPDGRETLHPPRSALEVARESPDVRARRLTPREVEILAMLAAGHSTPAVAARLHISRLTARNHVQNVLDKLEVHSKSEAVAFAFQKHLL